jgi:hypothetical protein
VHCYKAPNLKSQDPKKLQNPNYKNQRKAPNESSKTQITNFKTAPRYFLWNLGFGILLFGSWNLLFEIL